ncbi:hypothetical protein Ciccas_014532, partial [Cichlidogyrus casuarinus]
EQRCDYQKQIADLKKLTEELLRTAAKHENSISDITTVILYDLRSKEAQKGSQ